MEKLYEEIQRYIKEKNYYYIKNLNIIQKDDNIIITFEYQRRPSKRFSQFASDHIIVTKCEFGKTEIKIINHDNICANFCDLLDSFLVPQGSW